MRAGVRSLGLILFLAIASACGGAGSSPASAPSGSPQVASPAVSSIATSQGPIVVRDDAGRVVTLAAPPKRIVSASPSTTELAFAVGLGDEIVAVDKFSNYPPEATSRTSIGSYTDPDLEPILGANPDLVLATDIHVAQLVPALEKQGIPTIVLSAKNIEGVLLNLLLLGRVAGDEAEADKVVADLRTRIAAVETRVAGNDPVSVFYELDPSLFTTGPGTFIDDVIRRAGGHNIASASTEPYPQLSAEEVIAADPAVILLADKAAGVTPQSVGTRSGWAKLSAVKNGRIVVIDPDIGSRPGPRVVDALELIAVTLHPGS